MNWRFICKWVVTFSVATFVYNLTLRLTNGGRWTAFFMALGVMILLAVAVSYCIDWYDARKEKRQEEDNQNDSEE